MRVGERGKATVRPTTTAHAYKKRRFSVHNRDIKLCETTEILILLNIMKTYSNFLIKFFFLHIFNKHTVRISMHIVHFFSLEISIKITSAM